MQRRGRRRSASASQWLNVRVADLEARVELLEAQLGSGASPNEVIVLRSVSKEAAKGEILELFQSGEVLFYSDIAARLGLDLSLVVAICQELEQEGAIQVDADAV